MDWRFKIRGLSNLSIANLCIPQTYEVKKIDEKLLICNKSHEEGSLTEKSCENALSLLKLTVHVNDYLSKTSILGKLEPSIEIIGSIKEGTRILLLNEIDANLVFGKLQSNIFEEIETAFYLKTSDQGAACFRDANLPQVVTEKGDIKVFNYPVFLEIILNELDRAIDYIVENELCPDIDFQTNETWLQQKCKECRTPSHTDAEALHKHCNSCRPSVCMSKRGPCIQLVNTKLGIFNSIDLCPVFSLRSKTLRGTLAAMGRINRLLIASQSVDAILHILKFLSSDRVMPEVFAQLTSGEINLGFKLFSFSKEEDNFILKPGQLLGPVKEFDDIPLLKDVYICIKGLKDVLGVDLPSYLVKKVLFKDTTKALARKCQLKEDPLEEMLFNTLNLNEIKPAFVNLIDWKEYNKP